MGEENVSLLVEGGQASAGPPLGPSLAPIESVDIGEIVDAINEETQEFDGMEVPVDVTVDTDTGKYTITVGLPPAAALIKQRAGIESGSGEPQENYVGNVSFDDVVDVAQMKEADLNALTLKSAVKEIMGSCRSMGVTIDDKPAEDATNDVDEGVYDDQIAAAEHGEEE